VAKLATIVASLPDFSSDPRVEGQLGDPLVMHQHKRLRKG